MEFKDKVIIVTGGAQGIGRCLAEEFGKLGAKTCVIDLQERPSDLEVNLYQRGDIAKQEVLDRFIDEIVERYGRIDFLINNAMPLFKGIDECSYEEFCYAQRVGVVAPFYLSK